MEPFTIALCYAGYHFFRYLKEKGESSTTPPMVSSPPEKLITFVGATGAGKSSTANALLGCSAFSTGVEHGTTTVVAAKEYLNGYSILDTPGLMDDTDFTPAVWSSIKRSKIVIYTATQQLYRKEIETLKAINTFQKNDLYDRKIALYINMQDVAKSSKTSAMLKQESVLIRQQVSELIPPQQVVFGSAHPAESKERLQPQIEDLKALIHSFIS
jgi:predicted GTPase